MDICVPVVPAPFPHPQMCRKRPDPPPRGEQVLPDSWASPRCLSGDGTSGKKKSPRSGHRSLCGNQQGIQVLDPQPGRGLEGSLPPSCADLGDSRLTLPSSPRQPWEQGGLLLPGDPPGSELVPGAGPHRHHRVRTILEEGAASGRCAHHW